MPEIDFCSPRGSKSEVRRCRGQVLVAKDTLPDFRTACSPVFPYGTSSSVAFDKKNRLTYLNGRVTEGVGQGVGKSG